MSSASNNLKEQAIIDNFKEQVGDIRINSLDDITDNIYKKLEKFFLSYDQNKRINVYKILKYRNYFTRGYKHSHDNIIKQFDCLRKNSQEDAINELKTTLEKLNVERYDVSLHKDFSGQLTQNSEQKLQEQIETFPELNRISDHDFYRINKLVGKLYDLYHLKHFIKLFNEYSFQDQTRLLSTHKYAPIKNNVRYLENNIIFINANDDGHALAQQLDIFIEYNLSSYTEEKLKISDVIIENKIKQLLSDIVKKDPIPKQEDSEYRHLKEIDELTRKMYIKTHKGYQVTKTIDNIESSYFPLNKSKYLVKTKDYEKLYMKYKAKYLKLKKQLNI